MTINSKVESFEIARLKEQLHKLQVLQQKAQAYLKAKRDAEEEEEKEHDQVVGPYVSPRCGQDSLRAWACELRADTCAVSTQSLRFSSVNVWNLELGLRFRVPCTESHLQDHIDFRHPSRARRFKLKFKFGGSPPKPEP